MIMIIGSQICTFELSVVTDVAKYLVVEIFGIFSPISYRRRSHTRASGII